MLKKQAQMIALEASKLSEDVGRMVENRHKGLYPWDDPNKGIGGTVTAIEADIAKLRRDLLFLKKSLPSPWGEFKEEVDA